jgi:hypothetical protein
MGKGKHALMKHVSLLPKRTINRIFTKGWFLHQQDAFLLVFFSNGNVTAQCKNHPMENKLIKIFEI